MSAKYRLVTLGCKVNQYESQVIREMLDTLGYRPAVAGERADLAVVNTCAVTAEASRKSLKTVRHLTHRGRTRVIVVGCAATADARTFSGIEGVKAVLGHDKDVCSELRELLANQPVGSSTSRLATGRITDPSEPAGAAPSRRRDDRNDENMSPMDLHNRTRSENPQRLSTKTNKSIPHSVPLVKENDGWVARIERFDGHHRAFLKIQDGCDAHCTYCIIPQLRPNLRSKPVEAALEEARGLVASGYREIILTGVFLGAYGRATAIRKRFQRTPSPLARLVCAIAQINGLARLRLSSLEPGDVDDELLEVLRANPACVPHLHLPLQSGSGDILRRMNRQYGTDQFLDMIERVRRALDRPAITTDIIVGFPGETASDFEASVEVARCAGFCKIHAFPFSPRQHTAAARWRDQFVPAPLVRERMARMAQVEAECSLRFRRQFVGQFERVIVEQPDARHGRDEDGAWTAVQHGRTDRYFSVHFEDDQARPGDLVRVRIDRVTPNRTHGTCVHPGRRGLPLPVLA